ncbi:hypothetical protein CR513_32753, partial [Mucuna pruriens]
MAYDQADKERKLQLQELEDSINPSLVQIPHSNSQSISALGILMTIAKCSSISVPRNYAITTSSVDRD